MDRHKMTLLCNKNKNKNKWRRLGQCVSWIHSHTSCALSSECLILEFTHFNRRTFILVKTIKTIRNSVSVRFVQPGRAAVATAFQSPYPSYTHRKICGNPYRIPINQGDWSQSAYPWESPYPRQTWQPALTVLTPSHFNQMSTYDSVYGQQREPMSSETCKRNWTSDLLCDSRDDNHASTVSVSRTLSRVLHTNITDLRRSRIVRFAVGEIPVARWLLAPVPCHSRHPRNTAH